MLSRLADSTANAANHVYAQIVQAHATLASGDTLAALRFLPRLKPVDRRPVVGWGIYEALGLECLTLVCVLVARGEYHEAIRVASAFDSQQPISYLLYRPRSLELRIQAAEAIGDTRLADLCREELATLRDASGND